MANRKMNARYYFTVEGETEKWYLEWMRDAINADPGPRSRWCAARRCRRTP